jgi:hypothetical protein
MSHDSTDYIVTARHLFPGATHNQEIGIEILQDKTWKKGQATLLVHPNPKIDVAVLRHSTNERKFNTFSVGGSYQLSQDCFFLGFPFGLTPIDGDKVNQGFPVPMVKKAIISAFTENGPNGVMILLDGINNSGFSGGPVVVVDLPTKEQPYRNRVIGVVVGYKGDPHKKITTPFGEFLTNENTGIIITYSIFHVNEILDANKKK